MRLKGLASAARTAAIEWEEYTQFYITAYKKSQYYNKEDDDNNTTLSDYEIASMVKLGYKPEERLTYKKQADEKIEEMRLLMVQNSYTDEMIKAEFVKRLGHEY